MIARSLLGRISRLGLVAATLTATSWRNAVPPTIRRPIPCR